MARGVEIEWTSKDTQIVKTLQRTEQGMESLMRKMDKVEAASKKAATTTETGFDKATKKVVGMAQALIGGGSLLTAVDMVRRANEEMIRQADEAAKKYDELFRKFRVQANLSQVQGAEAQAWISANAEKNAVPIGVATGGALGLVGAGFSAKDATGSALNVLLRARAATNATGGNADDLEGIATSVSAYLTSQGLEKNAKNLQSVLQGGFALRQTGAFELSDLTELGKHGAAMRGLLSQQEQFAAFGTLVDQMPSAEAGTSLRNIVSRLSTSAVGRTSKQAIERIGLAPTDVDLVGENFGQVLDTLGQRLQTLPEEERAGVLKQLFEEAGVAPARALINERRGRYLEYQRGMSEAGGIYSETVEVSQSGPNAALIRSQIRQERRAAARSERDDVFQQYLDEQFALQPSGSAVRRSIASGGFKTLRSFGFDQETAAGITYGSATDGTDMVAAAQRQRAIDEGRPIRVEVVNPEGGPRIQQNAAAGFGR